MASSIIPLRLSTEVVWERRLKETYDALPKTRRMEFLRGLLQRGLQAVEAEQAGDGGLTHAAPAPIRSAVPPAVATVAPAAAVGLPSVSAPEPVLPPSPATAPAIAAVVPAQVAPAPAGTPKSALEVLGGGNFLRAARSSVQTTNPPSQA